MHCISPGWSGHLEQRRWLPAHKHFAINLNGLSFRSVITKAVVATGKQ
jgi:hypothetical protein